MSKHAIDLTGEVHDTVEKFGEATGDLYSHTRGNEYVARRHKITVKADIVLVPAEVADILVNMSIDNFASVFEHLYQRTQVWGDENRAVMWGQVSNYLRRNPDNHMGDFIAEMNKWVGDLR